MVISFKSIEKGQTLIELLLAVSLTAIFLPVLLTSFVSTREGRVQSEQRVEATLLQREAIEAVRSVRERDWDEIAVNGTYYPYIQGGQWELETGSETVDIYTRSIDISDVYRDSVGDIVETGGELDPSTKQIDVAITWSTPSDLSLESTFFLSRFENEAYIETTEGDFNGGDTTSVAVTNTNGGEITLGSGGHGDWCTPSEFVVTELNLQASGDARNVSAIEGKAFTGTHVGGAGKFYEIGISNDDPPIAQVANTINGVQTNDVFIDEDYAYVATGDRRKDIIIVDLQTGEEVGYFDDARIIGYAEGIWVEGDVGYVTIGPAIHTFDLSEKTGKRPELDSIWFGFFAKAYDLQVKGDYAYIAADFPLGFFFGNGLQLVDVSDPSNLSEAGFGDVNGEAGRGVVVNETGTRAYLATESSSSLDEFFVINTEDKNEDPLPVIGSYDAGIMDPTGLTIVPGNIAILAGEDGEEYQVLNIADETSPVRCGGMHVNSGIYGISSVLEADNDAYSYIISGDASSEFKIIEGGPGGSFNEDAEFTSQTFDAGSDVVFNRLITNTITPPQTEVYFQVGITEAVGGSCSGVSFTFVGPDGTDETLFPGSGGTIPIDNDGAGFENPGRCFRYKAYLMTNDFASTPVIEDVTVNYSL